ncbi:MAG: alpha-galactosidase, partial [Planctomycetota bacterium]
GGPFAGLFDLLPMADRHLTLTRVDLRGVTDEHHEIAATTRTNFIGAPRRLGLTGNLFSIDDPHTGTGLVLVRHGMLPASAYPPRRGSADLQLHRGTIALLDATTRPTDEPTDDGWFESDWHALLAYTGGPAGRTRLLQRYEQHLRRPELSPRRMLSNTWGDRGRDGRLGEQFLLDEVDAAADLGVDIVQIDDGWQAGRSANSVDPTGGKWTGFWEDETFWDPHPQRLPNGLEPILAATAKHDLRLGLWYAPDSADDFANWPRDVERILQLHQRYGVDHFKLDSVDITSGRGQANFDKLLDGLRVGSGGRVVLDLDATAGRRPDYLGRPDTGPVFVENRYTDWGNYQPHLTLRALWQLTHWIDPARLRFEWLNPDRNTDRYPQASPLAPSAMGIDYLFAITMVAQPLAWLELQQLDAARRETLRPLVRRWCGHRDAWSGASVLPIGAAPGGGSWTGFQIVTADESAATHVVLFREPLAPAVGLMHLPVAASAVSNVVHGDDVVTLRDGSTMLVESEQAGSCHWLTLSR